MDLSLMKGAKIVKLNLDCIRDILLCMEKAEYMETLSMPQVYEALPSYSHEDINYSALKLAEAGLIDATTISYDGAIDTVAELNDILFEGHEFLANIREATIWNGVKSVAAKVGSQSLSALIQIASNVVVELIKAQFGLL